MSQVRHRQMKNDLVFTGISYYEMSRKRALEKVNMVFHYAHLQILLHRYFQLIHLVQKRLRGSLATKYDKVEILKTYWNKLLGKIYMSAKKKDDQEVLEICGNIIKVPKEVQQAILKRYINACRKVHSIAFFQWRLLNHSKQLQN